MNACEEVIGSNKEKFVKYVVCQQCNHLCSYEDATKEHRNGLFIQLCTFVKFPHYPIQKNA